MLTPSGIGCKSLVRLDPRYRVREMSLDDIERVKTEFAEAATRATAAGARFVQLQASNGYLLSSFLSKATNRRTDDYGGDPERRARFVVEVVEAVRAAIGPDVVLGLRLGLNDYLGDKGMEPADVLPAVPRLEVAGTDLFEASFCVADTFSKLLHNTPDLRGKLADQVRKLRNCATVPVGFAGFIGSLADGCALIDDGVIDFIAMARALLADNDLVLKEVAGREDDVHRCLWDGNCFRDKYNPRFQRVHCCVNPKCKRPAGSRGTCDPKLEGPNMSVSEPVCLVTGGTKGIGLVVAKQLAREGAKVVISSRSAASGAEALAAFGAEGLTAEFLPGDVAEAGTADALIARILDRHGRLDWAFNNAGATVPHANIADSSVEAWNRAIATNLTGVYFCLRAELAAMATGGGGAIVNNSSLAGVTAIPGQAAYVASKFGVIGLTQAAAIEYAREPGIRVNAIAPGPITGGMNSQEALDAYPEHTRRKLGVTAMRRMGAPEEVASVVSWLLSDRASYVTGAVVPIDGGAAAGKF